MPRPIVASAVALLALAAAAPAAAVTYTVALTGDPTSGSSGGNSYRFQLAGAGPITIADGDTIEADLSFSSPFTVPAGPNGQFIFLEFYRTDGLNPVGATSSTASNLINGAPYTGGCSNCIANLFDNGGLPLTFSGGRFSTTFALENPFEITDFQFGYQVDAGGPPAAVPEPAAWAMMAAGFGLVGGMMRRRRGGVALAA